MAGVVAAAATLLTLLVATTPPPVTEELFLVIPRGWIRFLGGFGVVVAALSSCAYLYGRARRPARAGQYALTAGTHLFIWLVIGLVFYPVVYLLSVSFNRNNSVANIPPKGGNLLVRSGVLPDPAEVSLVQYAKVLSDTHLDPYQWGLIVLATLALSTLLGLRAMRKRVDNPYRLERYQQLSAWGIFLCLVALVLSIQPGHFYALNRAGEQIPASSERMIVLYIRNTLLVSGTTGLLAVLLSTTAGYAFARMRFEGRYQTLLTFVFVQMFPSFMALVAIFYLMSYLDLLNTFVGLILAYSGAAIAFSSWIFKGYLESVSPSLEEAAMVDGATRWGAFWRIILPISVPMLLFIFLLQFIGTYSEFILANTILIGQEHWTVGIGLRQFSSGRFDTQWGALAASAVLGSLPILLIFYSFQEALTGQYTAGGVKG
ncbi:MAG: sugar ABC transporter permease [Trueperaceae bacterium]|nr:MAG: sugar ABC transporter permease [Trueperaceae bacterium]